MKNSFPYRNSKSGRRYRNEPCPSCRSNGRDYTGNHLMVFEDGGVHCNRCGLHEASSNKQALCDYERGTMNIEEIMNLPCNASRGITAETAEFFGVRYSGDSEFYPITKDGEVIAYKERKYPKSFRVHGNGKGEVELFGQHLYEHPAVRLIITGGEIDAMSAHQMLRDSNVPIPTHVVSLPTGEDSKAIADNYEWIDRYKQIYVCTDMDDQGRKCAGDISKIFPEAKIVELDKKDANEMLQAGHGQHFGVKVSEAKEFVPEGIYCGSDINFDDIWKPSVHGYSLPYPLLNNKLHGLRKGEITTLTAGSGIGKSTMAREIMYHMRNAHDLKLGHIFLEEDMNKTLMSYVAMDNMVPLPVLREDPSVLDRGKAEASYQRLVGGDSRKWWGLEHFGSIVSDKLMVKLRYLATVKRCDFICIDHLSMVISGLATSDERKEIDMLMTKLAAFVNETGVGIIAIVHLKRTNGKASFNEGGSVSLNDLRGSAALEQLSWNVLALERDQQSAGEADLSRIRILKNREWGNLGLADTCAYNHNTGRHTAVVYDGDI